MQQIPSPTSRSGAKSQRRREIRRAIVAGVALAGIFATAIEIGSKWKMPSLNRVVYATATPPQADDDLTTGSIVFVPDFGDKCQASEIDNATWRVRQLGTVSCREALAGKPASHTESRPRTRIDIIRESFRRSAD